MTVPSIIDAVASGNIGSPIDWSRWANIHQVRIDDLKTSAELLAASDSALGRVVHNSGLSITHVDTAEAIRFLDELKRVLPVLMPEDGLTRDLIQVAGYRLSMRRRASEVGNAALETIKSFIQVARRFHHHVGREMANAIVLSDLSPTDKIDPTAND